MANARGANKLSPLMPQPGISCAEAACRGKVSTRTATVTDCHGAPREGKGGILKLRNGTCENGWKELLRPNNAPLEARVSASQHHKI